MYALWLCLTSACALYYFIGGYVKTRPPLHKTVPAPKNKDAA